MNTNYLKKWFNADTVPQRNSGGNYIDYLLKKNQFKLLDSFYCPIYHKINLGLFVTLKGLNGRLREVFIGTTRVNIIIQ